MSTLFRARSLTEPTTPLNPNKRKYRPEYGRTSENPKKSRHQAFDPINDKGLLNHLAQSISVYFSYSKEKMAQLLTEQFQSFDAHQMRMLRNHYREIATKLKETLSSHYQTKEGEQSNASERIARVQSMIKDCIHQYAKRSTWQKPTSQPHGQNSSLLWQQEQVIPSNNNANNSNQTLQPDNDFISNKMDGV